MSYAYGIAQGHHLVHQFRLILAHAVAFAYGLSRYRAVYFKGTVKKQHYPPIQRDINIVDQCRKLVFERPQCHRWHGNSVGNSLVGNSGANVLNGKAGIFTKFTATGAISTANFVSGANAVALDSNDYLVYNTTNGSLYYDADGNGAGAQVEIVALTGIPPLTAADFNIV